MKIFSQLLMATFLFFGLSCSSSKQEVYQLQKEAAFKIKKATYQEWVAGVAGGGAGITIILDIEEVDTNNITLDSIYFRNYKAPLLKSKGNYIAHIKTEINKPDDIILHQSPQKEYGNQAPVLKNNTSFDLLNKEAVIRFKEKNKIKYVKIILVQIASPLYQ
ncbi:MAG: hypothetical protein QM478_02135 [Flavobacteriaceae bacterium]